MQVNIMEFRPRPSGARVGFVDVELVDSGLIVRDVVVFRGYRGWSAKMPARRVQVDETRVEYHPYLAFDAHQAAAVEQAICAAVEGHIEMAAAG